MRKDFVLLPVRKAPDYCERVQGVLWCIPVNDIERVYGIEDGTELVIRNQYSGRTDTLIIDLSVTNVHSAIRDAQQ